MPNRLTGSRLTARIELLAFFYAVVPHQNNNRMDKLLTLLLFLAWLAITIGIAYGWAVPAEGYGMLSAFVGYRVGTIKERDGAPSTPEGDV